MASAEQCRAALESLIGRIAELDAANRQANLLDRTLSCHVPDLGITFLTRLNPAGAEPITEAAPTAPRAQVRFTADSDTVVAVAADPGSLLRAWVTGKLKVSGSVRDLLHLRKLF
ncbi:MAG TPA: SCP2 sterol-binding domain-containing protein [Streptosporangiaceae bacterium]